jgi:hypothetical protein
VGWPTSLHLATLHQPDITLMVSSTHEERNQSYPSLLHPGWPSFLAPESAKHICNPVKSNSLITHAAHTSTYMPTLDIALWLQ